MTSRERRAFMKRWETQRNEERNGAPVPPEIAARMTKPKSDLLYQVVVETRGAGMLPVGPMLIKAAADQFRAAIAGQVALGKEKHWFNPTVVPCMPISQGVH